MYRWAHDTQGVTTFVASISPDNIASLNLIEEYGLHPDRRSDGRDRRPGAGLRNQMAHGRRLPSVMGAGVRLF